MDKTKIVAFCRKFGFVGNADPMILDAVFVRRITPELLRMREGENEVITLYNERGEHLGRVWEGNEIGNTILALKNPANVSYVAVFFSVFQMETTITVYKPPTGWTIQDWVEKQLHRAEAEVDKQISLIDAEA